MFCFIVVHIGYYNVGYIIFMQINKMAILIAFTKFTIKLKETRASNIGIEFLIYGVFWKSTNLIILSSSHI